MNPFVSVLVTTYNSSSTLDACLNSIIGQSYTNWELVVIDNYSTDRTVDIAKKFGSTIVIKRCGRSEGINLGAKLAQGEYIYRLDSDCIAEPTLIQEAVDKCAEGYHGVVVPVTTHPMMGGWAKIRKLERDMYLGDPTHVAARFIEKRAFEWIGGFDERLTAGEDFDFHLWLLKAGFKLADIQSKELDIGGPTTLRDFAVKNYRLGKTVGVFLKANPKKGLVIIQPFRLAYWHHRKLFLSRPENFLGIIVLNLAGRYMPALVGWATSRF